MKIAITISRLGVGVLPCSEFLIPLRRIVNVKIIKCDVFDMVGVFVALAGGEISGSIPELEQLGCPRSRAD